MLNARFALFLLLVIKKLMSLTSANAGLQVTTSVDTWHVASDPSRWLQSARCAAVKQAETARRSAEAVMDTDGGREVRRMREALEEARREAEVARREVRDLKRQSESMAREYDKLTEAKGKVEKKSMFGWKRF